MNPFSAIGGLVLGLIKQKIIQGWVKLIFQIVVSMVGSFLLMCSLGIAGAFAAKCNAATAMVAGIGNGCLWAALVLGYYVRQAPQLKGMMFVFPALEATKEIEADFETIIRSEK
jgi:hypothetical protein